MHVRVAGSGSRTANVCPHVGRGALHADYGARVRVLRPNM
ncbi:hypothetical protein BRPE64_BCDS08320 [Caballeronia insecticola]|uniref:Uncharacterized protein n=1 Tax=Caballeronia insecticola TaxID=758793 RepID=R4WLL6_9BURK|nr:hypothetical protein BRPE64_BCDS08320 [Caballeronia insecticola]